MALGAVGLVGVTTHVATRRFRELIDAVNANDLGTARKINFEATTSATNAATCARRGVNIARTGATIAAIIATSIAARPMRDHAALPIVRWPSVIASRRPITASAM
jgi:4-hydroxy-tetrahydrodipicolinate synthase